MGGILCEDGIEVKALTTDPEQCTAKINQAYDLCDGDSAKEKKNQALMRSRYKCQFTLVIMHRARNILYTTLSAAYVQNEKSIFSMVIQNKY